MATTTIQTVNVSTIDEDGKQTTFNLDNPKDGLTKGNVIEAFNYGINNGMLISNYGSLIKSVGTVILATSTKIELEGDPVYITPNSLTFNLTSQAQQSDLTVTVSSNIQAASVMELTQTSGTTATDLSCYVNSITESASSTSITVRTYTTFPNIQATASLKIVINGITYSVPITITHS